jgi:membrane-associated phospholipid phosphatase
MNFLFQQGINWIVAIQGLGGWLEAPMRFFTFLGTEEFFLLILPAIYWSIDSALGLRVAMALFFSVGFNEFFKMLFASPRPYWVSVRVKPFASETSFGIPSGHAQNAADIWGMIAARSHRTWARVAAILLIFLIGFSRLYLGVHFLHDVIFGWFLGAALLWVILHYWDSAVEWLKQRTFEQQTLIAFVVSMVFVLAGALVVTMRSDFVLDPQWIENALRAGEEPDPVSMDGILTIAGAFFGMTFGLAWASQRGGYQAEGSVMKRVLRYLLGLVGIVILYIGLGAIFPRGEAFIPYALRYVRYWLVGFWITAGAPWLFFRFKLAKMPNM